MLERADFEQRCRNVGIEEKVSQETLIRYLNDLGVALHFEDEELDLLQILNPKWATQAVYRLITAPKVVEAFGLLQLGDTKTILQKLQPTDYDYAADKHKYIVDLMRKFELCYDVNNRQVLLPDLLNVQEPQHNFPQENILRFRYKYDYLPKSIMPRLIVKLHADIEGKLQWRTGVVLKARNWNARARVRADKSAKRISIEVEGPQRRDYFAVIFDAIETIHEGFTKLKLDRKVPLPDHPEFEVSYEDLIFHRELKQKSILVGSLKKTYPVEKLLDGIDLVQKRQKTISKSATTYIENYYEGDDMSKNVTVGDNNKSIGVAIGENISQGVAETIKNCFNVASEAKSDSLRPLLEQLVQEMAKVIEKLPEEKAEEASDYLKSATEQAAKAKPTKSIWELSKQGMIDAAQTVGVVGSTAIKLIGEISNLLS